MLTREQRADINRINAARSTGPKSPEGKQRSAMNAYRHGLTGQVMILPGDDLEAYRQHESSFLTLYEPANAMESTLVQAIVDSAWQMHRCNAAQNQILCQRSLQYENKTGGAENNPQVNTALAMAAVMADNTGDLPHYSIYEQRHFRKMLTAEKRLLALQQVRKEREERELQEAELLLRLHEYEEQQKQEAREQEAAAAGASEQEMPPYTPIPYQPSEDGFVFSIVAIKARITRRERLQKAQQLFPLQAAAA